MNLPHKNSKLLLIKILIIIKIIKMILTTIIIIIIIIIIITIIIIIIKITKIIKWRSIYRTPQQPKRTSCDITKCPKAFK